jgi:hypothetical protein
VTFTANDGYQDGADTSRIYVFDRKYTTLDNSGDGIPSGRGQDAWISEFDNYSPHNYDTTLCASTLPGKAGKIYLKFDLSALPGPLFDAGLKLDFIADSLKKPISFNIFGLKETSKDMDFGESKLSIDWSEADITWDNAPANDPKKAGGQFNIRKNYRRWRRHQVCRLPGHHHHSTRRPRWERSSAHRTSRSSSSASTPLDFIRLSLQASMPENTSSSRSRQARTLHRPFT